MRIFHCFPLRPRHSDRAQNKKKWEKCEYASDNVISKSQTSYFSCSRRNFCGNFSSYYISAVALTNDEESSSCPRVSFSQVRRVIFAIFYFLGMKKNDNNVIFMRFLWNELFRSRFLFLSPSRLTWEKWFHLSSPASWRTLFRRCLSFEWLGSRLSAGREIFLPLDAISLDIAWNIIKNGFVFGIFTAFEYQGWIKHFSISEINFARYSAWRLS